MNIFYIFLSIILIGLMSIGIFLLGAFFSRRFILEALDEARHDRMMSEYYRMTDVRNTSDPKPYVPPRAIPTAMPRTPRNTIIPGMGALDRLLKEGKRGTLMVRAGDRRR